MAIYTYQTSITDMGDVTAYSTSIQAGNLTLGFDFKWNTVLQSKYDEVVQALKLDRDSDPILGPNYKDADYDLLDYYCNQMPYPVNMQWVSEQTNLPNSAYKKDVSAATLILRDKQETYRAIKVMMDSWNESLAWNVRITDGSGNVVTGYVRPGGTIKAEEYGWNVRFLADVDSVAKDKLGIVTIQIEVYV